jgi:hypothetical protein
MRLLNQSHTRSISLPVSFDSNICESAGLTGMLALALLLMHEAALQSFGSFNAWLLIVVAQTVTLRGK